MGYTVGDIYNVIDAFAPFETAQPWDNVGLLVGRMDSPVDTILTALDATVEVIREARDLGAQLLVTHHPVMFSPIRRLDEAEPEAALLGEMIRAGLSMIAAHTNLDIADGGVNDTLAEQVQWRVTAREGFLCMGALDVPTQLERLRLEVSQALGAQVTSYGAPDRRMARFAICCGAGGSEVAGAAVLGADVLLTGEIKHDQALEAMARGLCVLAAGHRATEICAADLLAKHLHSVTNAVKSKVRIFVSQINPFG